MYGTTEGHLLRVVLTASNDGHAHPITKIIILAVAAAGVSSTWLYRSHQACIRKKVNFQPETMEITKRNLDLKAKEGWLLPV
jgi:flagellar basal body rod protein FlgF